MKFSIEIDTTTVTPAFALDDSSPMLELKPMLIPDFIEKFYETAKTPIGLLPPAVRWISQDRRVIVFERPPSMYFMEIAQARKEEAVTARRQTVEIPVPWTVYVGYYDYEYNPVHIRAYTRPAPLEELSDPLYLLPIPNIYNDSSLCNPVVGVFEEHEASISYGVQEAFNMVWNSGFNYDLLMAANIGRDSGAPCTSIASGRDAFSSYFAAWSKMTIPEVLKATFPKPSQLKGEYIPHLNEDVTVLSVIDAVRAAATNPDGDEEMHDPASELIVQMVNIFS